MQNFEALLKLANEARTRIREVSPVEAESLVTAGAVLIDVRDDREFAAGHIPGARLLSRESLPALIQDAVPDRTTPVVCYCTFGHRSALAADAIQALGYTRVVSIEGGLKAYLAASPGRRIA